MVLLFVRSIPLYLPFFGNTNRKKKRNPYFASFWILEVFSSLSFPKKIILISLKYVPEGLSVCSNDIFRCSLQIPFCGTHSFGGAIRISPLSSPLWCHLLPYVVPLRVHDSGNLAIPVCVFFPPPSRVCPSCPSIC